MTNKVSARHALIDEELDFCKRVAAGLPYATAYRRAFKKDLEKEAEKKGVEEIPSKEISRRASALAKQEYIAAYLAELVREPGERAREVLTEQAMFGDDTAARSAAKEILADEERLGQRDAYESWAYIMSAIGAEVVITLPGGGEAAVPVREMFPKYKEALPPRDAVEKTIASLNEWLDKAASE